jgi:hypothetical protein
VEGLSYELLATAQDLHELLQRHCLAGPQRHSLFHDAEAQRTGWPDSIQQHGPVVETLLRGAGCLLANGLAPATLPLLRELLPHLRRLDTELSGSLAQGVRDYYAMLERELALGLAEDATSRAHYLCSELMALYLDLLCVARPELHATLGSQVLVLRRKLHQLRQVPG